MAHDANWLVGYPSGQRGQTVNLLAYAFIGSNPIPTTILNPSRQLAALTAPGFFRTGNFC